MGLFLITFKPLVVSDWRRWTQTVWGEVKWRSEIEVPASPCQDFRENPTTATCTFASWDTLIFTFCCHHATCELFLSSPYVLLFFRFFFSIPTTPFFVHSIQNLVLYNIKDFFFFLNSFAYINLNLLWFYQIHSHQNSLKRIMILFPLNLWYDIIFERSIASH